MSKIIITFILINLSLTNCYNTENELYRLSENLFESKEKVSSVYSDIEGYVKGLSTKTKSLINYVEDAKNTTNHTDSYIIQKLETDIIEDFSQSAMVQRVTGVKDTMLANFIKSILNRWKIPNEYLVNVTSKLTELSNSDSSNWESFKFIYTKDNKTCYYIDILAQHDQTNKKSNWMYTELNTKINLSNIFVVVSGQNETIDIVSKPSETDLKDIEVLIKYYEVAAIKSFRIYLGIRDEPVKTQTQVYYSEFDSLKFLPVPKVKAIVAGLVTLSKSLDTIAGTWSRLVSAFKITRESKIKEKLKSYGFDKFSQSASVQISNGIREEYIEQYLNTIAKKVNVPQERKEDLLLTLETIKWVDSNVWTASNILFSIDKGGNTKFFSILSNKDPETQKFNFVICDIMTSFSLAPDILVVNKKLSVLGGIWQDEKDERINIPRSLTEDDLSTVMSFFNLVVFKNFMNTMDIHVEFPKF